ncbi:MAG: hypothetical protein L0Z62_29645 [Gemmataceae bacterium]|nr:hypothetical protein [Gemmataceae bacterium]
MSQATATSDNKAPTQQTALIPPEDSVWVRYSPHHECPLSFLGSVLLHGLFLGGGFLLFLGLLSWGSDPANKPVEVKVVEIMGGEGLGLDGLGVGTTPLGGSKGKTDVQGPAGGPSQLPPKDQVAVGPLKDIERPKDLKFPEGKQEPGDDGGEVFSELGQTVKRVENAIAVALAPAPKTPGGTDSPKNYPNPKSGPGGKAGLGKGQGTKVGPGGGVSPYGQVLTKQKRRQLRWQILASPDGTIHLKKLQALNVTLVMPTNDPKEFIIFDLTRKPVAPKKTTLLKEHGDKVWWTNSDKAEVQALAQVLGLRKAPPCFVIFLPKPLEERMVQLEEAHQGAQEHQIAKTIWEVPLRDGHYAREPVIVEQQLYGEPGRPKR